MKKLLAGSLWLLMMLAVLGFSATDILAAAPVQTMVPINGEIEKITIDNPNDVWSGGTMTVGGLVVILPRNLLVNLPNDYQSLQQLYANAPAACRSTGETGLAKTDKCNARATGAQVNIRANRTSPGNNVIAGQVDIFKGLEVVNGTITYINTNDGYFRVNGILNDSATGVMVRVNDPTSRHTVQSGLGCAAGTSNCSPDERFKIDPDNYTFAFATGYPPCIPSPSINSNNCPNNNRPAQAPFISSNPFPSPPVAADSRHFAPILLGDNVLANGSFETVNGVTFLSAWAVKVQVDLTTDFTRNDQPDYLFIADAGFDGAAYPAGRVRGRILTNATDHNALIDYFTVHYDPVSNSPHEKPLYSVANNKKQGAVIFGAPTGVFDSQIRMDFFPGAKVLGDEPCLGLIGAGTVPDVAGNAINIASFCSGGGFGGTAVENFNLMVPIFREVMARSRHQHAVTANNVTAVDVHGRPTQFGQYKLPISIEYGAFEDINLGMIQFPYNFSGTPWLMDRRLSPNGCSGPCEVTAQPLNPFPFEGIDPRTVSPTFGVVVVAGGGAGGGGAGGNTPLPNPDRMFNFMDQNGNFTGLLPWSAASLNPAAIPITPVPQLNLFAPDAVNDTAITSKGKAVTIDVLANDVARLGIIDSATVKIVSSTPAKGTPKVNFDGSITYTPVVTFTGTDSFTYTVANNFGSVSNVATVTVTIAAPPVANADTATTTTGSQVSINVVANDTSNSSTINPGSVVVTTPPSCGTVLNQGNGTLLFTAPASVPPVPGTCTFGYKVSDNFNPVQQSNEAIVTVTVNAATNPVANNDSAAVTVNSFVDIDILANDIALAPKTIDNSTVAIIPQTGLQAVYNPVAAPLKVRYTAPATPGVYSFSYTVKDNTGAISNPAIVTVTVTSIAPTANNFAIDPASAGATTTIIVTDQAGPPPQTGHVTQGSNPVNPASIAVTQPNNGTTIAFADGTVNYTPNPGYVGADSFTYTVRDTLGTLSNSATVTLNVTAPAEVLTVTNAQYIVSNATWLIEGTSTARSGSVEIFNSTTVGTPGDQTSLGTTAISNLDGTWTLLLPNSSNAPNASRQISAQSSNSASLPGVTLVVR